MSKYVFDIETNGLLHACSTCWIVAAYNIETRTMQYWLQGDLGWKEVFSKAELLVGHNILNFDIPALEKLFGWTPSHSTRFLDTMLLSLILDYSRFGGRHSLEAWGEHLNKPKQEHEDWTQYSEEMRTRCISDVELNVEVYRELMKELTGMLGRAREPDRLKYYINAEHAVGTWSAQAGFKGWPFKRKEAEELYKKMGDELQATADKLTPLLGMKAVAVDLDKGEVEVKTPKFKKNGEYTHHTVSWFQKDTIGRLPMILAEEGILDEEDRTLCGPFCRVEFKPLEIGSTTDMKTFLYRHGWQPIEFNWKTVETDKGYEKVQMSPKITEESLEFLGGDGKLYADYLSTSARHAILKGWLANCDENDRVHGDCFTIGTPSFRSRHSIIVNVPSVEAAWGKEMRDLFTVLPGWSFIGADSASNQARGLAHYLKNEEFTHQLINGDIHTYNAGALDEVLKAIGFDWTGFIVKKGIKLKDEKDTQEKAIARTKRAAAKRILYAFLFGASGGKLWLYITGVLDEKQGKKLKNGFLKKVPGFEALMKTLENIYGKTSQSGPGYIIGLAEQRIYVNSYHKLLVYLLQAAEKATVSGACLLLTKWLREENIPYQPLIMMHDELDFMVPDEYAQRAAELAKKAFIEGPKLFGVNIMNGESKIGKTWYECH